MTSRRMRKWSNFEHSNNVHFELDTDYSNKQNYKMFPWLSEISFRRARRQICRTMMITKHECEVFVLFWFSVLHWKKAKEMEENEENRNVKCWPNVCEGCSRYVGMCVRCFSNRRHRKYFTHWKKKKCSIRLLSAQNIFFTAYSILLCMVWSTPTISAEKRANICWS